MTSSDGGFWKRHLDKVGVGGSLFAALCCLGFPALVAILSSVGLGFLLRDSILVPALLVFLGLALWGLYMGLRRHGRRAALVVGSVAALLLLGAVLSGNGVLAAIGGLGLISASFLNIWLARQA